MADNSSLMRRYAEALQRRDYASVDELLAEDVVVHIFGRHPLAGEHRGRSGFAAFTRDFADRTGVRMEMLGLEDVLVGDQHGALLMRERATRNGRTFEFERAVVYRLAADHIAELWVYDSDQHGLDVFAWSDS